MKTCIKCGQSGLNWKLSKKGKAFLADRYGNYHFLKCSANQVEQPETSPAAVSPEILETVRESKVIEATTEVIANLYTIAESGSSEVIKEAARKRLQELFANSAESISIVESKQSNQSEFVNPFQTIVPELYTESIKPEKPILVSEMVKPLPDRAYTYQPEKHAKAVRKPTGFNTHTSRETAREIFQRILAES